MNPLGLGLGLKLGLELGFGLGLKVGLVSCVFSGVIGCSTAYGDVALINGISLLLLFFPEKS